MTLCITLPVVVGSIIYMYIIIIRVDCNTQNSSKKIAGGEDPTDTPLYPSVTAVTQVSEL